MPTRSPGRLTRGLITHNVTGGPQRFSIRPPLYNRQGPRDNIIRFFGRKLDHLCSWNPRSLLLQASNYRKFQPLTRSAHFALSPPVHSAPAPGQSPPHSWPLSRAPRAPVRASGLPSGRLLSRPVSSSPARARSPLHRPSLREHPMGSRPWSHPPGRPRATPRLRRGCNPAACPPTLAGAAAPLLPGHVLARAGPGAAPRHGLASYLCTPLRSRRPWGCAPSRKGHLVREPRPTQAGSDAAPRHGADSLIVSRGTAPGPWAAVDFTTLDFRVARPGGLTRVDVTRGTAPGPWAARSTVSSGPGLHGATSHRDSDEAPDLCSAGSEPTTADVYSDCFRANPGT